MLDDAVMRDCHLPDAVRYEDRGALARLDDARLQALLAECDDWFACIEELRSALTTEAGRTEWRVQTRQDRADVTAAMTLLRAEMRARSAMLISAG